MVKLTCDDVCKMISLVAGILLLLSHVCLLVTPWTAARKASLSFIISWSLLKLMSIEGDGMQPSCPLLFPSSPAFNLSQHQGLFQ